MDILITGVGLTQGETQKIPTGFVIFSSLTKNSSAKFHPAESPARTT